jgi:hypothetical protein
MRRSIYQKGQEVFRGRALIFERLFSLPTLNILLSARGARINDVG